MLSKPVVPYTVLISGGNAAALLNRETKIMLLAWGRPLPGKTTAFLVESCWFPSEGTLQFIVKPIVPKQHIFDAKRTLYGPSGQTPREHK